jgi:hypothetical protein
MSATPVTAASMDIECAAAPAAAAAAPQKSAGRRWGLAAAVLATAALSVGAIAALTTQQSQQAAQLAADRSLFDVNPDMGSLRNIRLQIGISTEVDIPTKTAEMGDRPRKDGDPGYAVKVDMGLMYQPITAVNANYFQYVVDVSPATYLHNPAHCPSAQQFFQSLMLAGFCTK